MPTSSDLFLAERVVVPRRTEKQNARPLLEPDERRTRLCSPLVGRAPVRRELGDMTTAAEADLLDVVFPTWHRLLGTCYVDPLGDGRREVLAALRALLAVQRDPLTTRPGHGAGTRS